MAATEVDDYDKLKDAFLCRYNITEEGFRHKFQEAEPDGGETFYQYVHRISRYFGRWTTLGGCPDSIVGLAQFIVREQVLAKCSPALSIFLRERKPKDFDEMITLGEQYLEAHGGSVGRNKKGGGSQGSRPGGNRGYTPKP